MTYTYDNLYQLRSMTEKYRPNVAYGYQSSDTYTFDEIGNIKTKAQSQDRLVWDNQTVNSGDTNPVVTQLAGSRFDHNVPALTYNLVYTYPAARPHGARRSRETPAGSTAADRTYSYDANGNNTGNTFKGDARVADLGRGEPPQAGQAQRRHRSRSSATTMKASARRSMTPARRHLVRQPVLRPAAEQPADQAHLRGRDAHRDQDRRDLHADADPELLPPRSPGTTSYTSDQDQNLVQHERYFAYGELWRPGGEQEESDRPPERRRRDWLFTARSGTSTPALLLRRAVLRPAHGCLAEHRSDSRELRGARRGGASPRTWGYTPTGGTTPLGWSIRMVEKYPMVLREPQSSFCTNRVSRTPRKPKSTASCLPDTRTKSPSRNLIGTPKQARRQPRSPSSLGHISSLDTPNSFSSRSSSTMTFHPMRRWRRPRVVAGVCQRGEGFRSLQDVAAKPPREVVPQNGLASCRGSTVPSLPTR